MNKQPIFFQLRKLLGRGQWRLVVDQASFLLTDEDTHKAITNILAMSKVEGDRDFTFGPFTIRGMDPAQFTRLQDYLSMFKEAFK